MADLLNWIDNADSYVCPKCRKEVNNPAKTDGRCRCGFQDPRYGVMTNRRYLEGLADYDFAKYLVECRAEESEEYDWDESLIPGFLEEFWVTSDGRRFDNADYDEAIEHEVWWLRQPRRETE